MKRFLLPVAILTFILCPPAGAMEEVPLLKDLRKPVEVKQEAADEAPILPSSVNPESRVADPASLCPENAVWYMTVPDSKRLVDHWDESPPGRFMNEPVLSHTLRNNRFGLGHLFSDLPESVITADRVGSIASAIELSGVLAKMSEKMAMAGYVDDEGRFSFLFLFDVGLDRLPAFDTMTDWETSFYLAYPGSGVLRGDHSGNFIDVWTMRDSANAMIPAEIVAGFVQNMAIVSNDQALARSCMDLLQGGNSVANSSWGQRLSASLSTSATADAIGYLRMDALLKGLESTPIARQSVARWADYIGHGGKDGEPMYYGLQFTPEGVRETFLMPSGPSATSSLVELLAKRVKPATKWSTTGIMPYQPNPAMFLAAQLDGKQLGGLLRQERRLFGLSADGGYFNIPPSVRKLFTNELLGIMTGEIGMAFYPAPDDTPSWLMIIPCSENPRTKLSKVTSMVERTGATIMSDEAEWRTKPSWTVISSDTIRRAGGHFLAIGSHGDLVLSTIDQMVAGSNFANNRDFADAVSKAEAGHGLLFYINLPEIVVREYPNLSHIMRSLYPRSSGFNSRPPLGLLRRYTKGVLGAIMPSSGNGNGGGGFTRVSVQAPIPMLGALASSIVLQFPRSMRAEGREAMAASRENLQALWLRLQLYSSRYGHFPDSLDVLMSEMRSTMSGEEVRQVFTAPAALSRLSPEAAMNESYFYLSGVTPSDEPDIPILFEAEPWSEDFSGMYPNTPNRAPNETGAFQPYRQFVLLDGRILAVPEKRFQEQMMTRLKERE